LFPRYLAHIQAYLTLCLRLLQDLDFELLMRDLDQVAAWNPARLEQRIAGTLSAYLRA